MLKKIKAFFKDWRNQSSYFRWIVRYTKPYIPSLILIMLCGCIGTLVSVVTSVIGKHIIDKASGGKSFVAAVLLYVLVVIISQIARLLSSMFTVVVNEKFSFGIRKQVYDKILHSNWGKIQKYHTGDLMTRLTSDAGTVAEGISSIIPSLVAVVIEFFATFFTLFYYDKTLALLALIIAPIAAFGSVVFGRKIKKLQVKVQESEAAYRGYMQESLANLLIVKTFCHEQRSVERFEELRNERIKWVFKGARMSMAASATVNIGFQLGYILAFAWGAFRLSTKAITYGTMSLFLTLVNRIQAPIYSITAMLPKLVAILASAGRIMELQDIELEERNATVIDKKDISLEAKNITFGYDENENILDNVNFNIKAGEFVAIIGESGVGKTTLVRLIMSFITTKEGSMRFFNGKGESEEAKSSSREFISYVPQGNTLFSGTIAYNVSMGNPDASREEIIDALKAACAYDFVCNLPEGIDTKIGEKGYGISEGQAQRIAIARAILKKASFLILDEATSSLDEQTELKVLENIRAIAPRPTCLLITHRKSVLQFCDRELLVANKKLEAVN